MPSVKRVILSYKKYQPIFDTMQYVELEQEFNKAIPTLLIIDNQMGDCYSKLTDLFTVCSHHDHHAIIFVSQGLFCQDKVYRAA